ncbi:MAG: DeoR family transcriptional regulator [Bacteroidetes bacterium]|jgi:undecaprenol kinase/diacylglycerol kinase (ATP)|nr:DeoR family transcriptional regulator [Bacteroidota bacterium]
MSYIKERGKSFAYAFAGLKAALKEHNFRIHVFAMALVVGLAFFFKVTRSEWCILIICCAMVICLELINSAIEKLCDKVEPGQDPKIKFVKDVSAAAVLIAAVASAVTGLIIFYPYFIIVFS